MIYSADQNIKIMILCRRILIFCNINYYNSNLSGIFENILIHLLFY